jgi:hypothetical protein
VIITRTPHREDYVPGYVSVPSISASLTSSAGAAADGEDSRRGHLAASHMVIWPFRRSLSRLGTSHVSFWAVLVRRLVVSATSRPKGGDMKHTRRQIGQRVQAAREQGIICYVYGKRG